MSREARDWAWQQAEQRTIGDAVDLLILLDLADVADEHGGNSYPSRARLAKHCMASERTITRRLALLVESGHLTVEAPATRLKSTTYRLNLGRQSVTPNVASGDNGVTMASHWGDTPLGERADEVEVEEEVNPLAPNGASSKRANGKPRATDDPVKRCAHRLAVKAMEREHKPSTPFPAVMKITESLLRGGWSDQQIEHVFTTRDHVVFTIAGLTAALEADQRERKKRQADARPLSDMERMQAEWKTRQEARGL